MRFSTSAAALAAATLLGLAQPAAASCLFSWVPTVQVPVSSVESQAQMAAQLSAQGYDHVILTASYPNISNPHPELNGGPINTVTAPVHPGWNGVAQKNGQTVQVYVTYP
jgi:hypothetical protein